MVVIKTSGLTTNQVSGPLLDQLAGCKSWRPAAEPVPEDDADGNQSDFSLKGQLQLINAFRGPSSN